MVDVTGIEIRLDGSKAEKEARRLDSTFGRLGKTGTNLEGGFNKLSRSTGNIRGSFDRLKQSVFSLEGAFAAIGLTAFSRELIDANLRLERMQNGLRFATGSAELAGSAIEFVRTEANRLGLEAVSVGQAFTGIAAAARGTALEGDAVREIFLGVAEAGAALNLRADEMEGALLAIQQMMSKGTVQAEELRGQLGERIVGAFGLASRAMGVTTSELNKMLEQGQVISEDFLPKFAAEMRKTFSKDAAQAAQGLQGDINRLKNAYNDFLIAVGDTGLISAFGRAVELLSPLFVGLARDIGDTITIIDRFLQKIGLVELKSVEVKLQNAGDKVVDLSGEIVNLTQKQDRLLKQASQDLGTTVEDLRKQLEAGFAEPLFQSFFGEGAVELQNQINQARAALNQAQSDYLGLSDTLVEVQKNSESTNESLGNVGTGPSNALIALRAQLDKVSAATTQYNERISLLKKELEAGNIEQSEFNKLAGLAKSELDKVLKGTNAAAKSTKAYADEQARLNDELTSAVESLDPLVRSANDYNRTVKILSSDLAKAELGQDRVNELLAKAKGEFLETAENIDKTTDSLNKSTDAAVVFTKEADPFADAWNRSIEDVSRAISDGLVGGFKDAASTIKNIFSSLLSSLVNAALRNRIIIPMGLAPGTAAAGGFGGGGFNPGSLFGLSNGATTVGANPISPMAAGGLPGGGASSLPFSGNLGFLNSSSFATNPFTSGIGGFAGNFGANALLGSDRGMGANIGGTIGAIGGSFLPIPIPGVGTAIGGFLGNAIGGLFGGGKSDMAQGGVLNLATGSRDLAGQTGKKFSQENADARTAVLDQAQQFSQTLAQIAGEAIQGSINIVIGSRDGLRLKTEGTVRNFGDDMDALLGGVFDSIVKQSGIFSGKLEDMVINFRGSNEQLAQFATSLATIQRYTKTDPFEDFTEVLLSGTRTLYQQALISRRGLIDLARSFDGSLDAANELANATQQRYQIELQLLQQIDSVARGISSSFADTREQIIQATLSQEQLYDRLSTRAEDLARQMQTAIDPQVIGELAAQINQLAGRAFGLLGEEQKQSSQAGFLDFLSGVENLAGQRLDMSRQSIAVDRDAGLSGTVASELSKVIGGFGAQHQRLQTEWEKAAVAQRESAEASRRAAEAQERAALARESYYSGMGGR